MYAIDPTKPIEYIPEGDKDKPKTEQTVFLLQPPHPEKVAKIKDKLWIERLSGGPRASITTRNFLWGSYELQLLKLVICGWKNFRYKDKKEVPFQKDSDGCCSIESLWRIPAGVRTEIFNFAQREFEGVETEETEGGEE